ncbi:hypothetical protein Bca52824_060178 [Brassica carinata]|uniref:RNase H type-1 domain-containing protein n=2 Tax=Brassica TaxID=3705 RepID=A0A8X7R0Y6_BRACI|nr:hypothetical protein Bca52824_060178 [Brassica carinata]
MAEALAIRSALLHAVNLNFNLMWLRLDSQVLIGALSSGRDRALRSNLGHRLAISFFLSLFFHQKKA